MDVSSSCMHPTNCLIKHTPPFSYPRPPPVPPSPAPRTDSTPPHVQRHTHEKQHSFMKKQHLNEKSSVFMHEPRQCDLVNASAGGRHEVSRQHETSTAASGDMAPRWAGSRSAAESTGRVSCTERARPTAAADEERVRGGADRTGPGRGPTGGGWTVVWGGVGWSYVRDIMGLVWWTRISGFEATKRRLRNVRYSIGHGCEPLFKVR